MTRTERFAKLSAIQKVHPTLQCHIFMCAICREYYEILLEPDT